MGYKLLELNTEMKVNYFLMISKKASYPGFIREINTDIVGSTAKKTLPFGVDVSSLIADFAVSPEAELYINGIKQLNSKTTISDYTDSFLVTVISENQLSQTNYAVTLNAEKPEATIIAYSVSNQIGTTVIDPVSKSIKVLVSNNANLNVLIPVFLISDFATLRIETYLQNKGVKH